MTASRRELLRGVLEDVRRQESACPEAPLAAFDAALQRWLEQRCLYQERSRGGLVPLQHDYVLWCGQELEVPCSLARFREWLVLQGFHLYASGLVHGLVLKADLWPQAAEQAWKHRLPN